MAVKTNSDGIPTFWSASGRRLLFLITAVATTDFLLFGYDQGVISGIVSSTAFTTAFPEVHNHSTYEGFITAIYAVGCFPGDHLGRRKSIFFGAGIMILGVVIQISAVPVGGGATAQFIVGRCITGVGNGINTSTVPTYQAECSKSHNREKLICIGEGNVAIGALIAYWIDYGCIYGPEDFVWRFPIAFQCVFAVIVIILMLNLPESPRWLMTKDRHAEAQQVIAALAGKPPTDTEVQVQAQVILDSIRASGHHGGVTPVSALFTNGRSQHLRRLLLGASSQMMQQLSGCNAVIYYFPILFPNSIGVDHNMALLLGGVNMIVYSIFATTSWFAVERVGRRKLFLTGTVGQSEINPLKTRAKANAVSTVSNWLWNFFTVMITPVLVDQIGWGTCLFFAALNAIFFPFTWFFYPETSQRSLEEIDLIFTKGYCEKMNYVRAAKELPRLSDEEVDARAREYGFSSGSDEEVGGQVRERGFEVEKEKDDEKQEVV